MITQEQAKNAPYSTMKWLAHAMYNAYCVQVGGKAYDGRPLPTAAEFFEDETKQKQARGWFAAASKAIELILGEQTMNNEQKNKATEAHGKLQSWLVGVGVPANWAKVGAGIIIGGAIGALATCQQSCESVTPQQVHAAHVLYHAISGEPCDIAQPVPVVVAKEK